MRGLHCPVADPLRGDSYLFKAKSKGGYLFTIVGRCETVRMWPKVAGNCIGDLWRGFPEHTPIDMDLRLVWKVRCCVIPTDTDWVTAILSGKRGGNKVVMFTAASEISQKWHSNCVIVKNFYKLEKNRISMLDKPTGQENIGYCKPSLARVLQQNRQTRQWMTDVQDTRCNDTSRTPLKGVLMLLLV